MDLPPGKLHYRRGLMRRRCRAVPGRRWSRLTAAIEADEEDCRYLRRRLLVDAERWYSVGENAMGGPRQDDVWRWRRLGRGFDEDVQAGS